VFDLRRRGGAEHQSGGVGQLDAVEVEVLDVGAGDLRVMRKMVAAGYQGEYHTLDIGHEHPYDYQDLSEVHRSYCQRALKPSQCGALENQPF